MKKYFEFQEKGHKYFLDGKPLTGITTVLGVIAKPALIQWAANMAVDYIWSKIPEYSKLTGTNEEKMKWAENIMQEARKAYLVKRDDAASKGTDIHKEIEEIIKGAIKNFNGFIQDFTSLEENKQINHFVNWALKNKVKFLESEKKMYSEKYWLGGTCDFTAVINEKKYVGDIKTGGIYDRIPAAQTAAYRMMLEEMGEKDFAGSVIVNIKKDGDFNEKKDVYWSFDYKEDLRLFMGALEIYRVLNNTKIINDNK